MKPSVVNCQRCAMPCLPGNGSPGARPFRRAPRGLCPACAVTEFFKNPDNTRGIGFALPPDFNPAGLLLPHIQKQFQQVLTIGQSDLQLEQIDWKRVVANWELPLRRQKGSA